MKLMMFNTREELIDASNEMSHTVDYTAICVCSSISHTVDYTAICVCSSISHTVDYTAMCVQ